MSQDHETDPVGEDFFQFIIKLQSLCRILSDHQVQEDFKCGKIVPVNNPKTILSSIDVISEIIFPNWNTLMFHNSIHIETSELHLRLLWRKSSIIFDLQSEHEKLELFSYNAWTEAFEELFQSPYWQNSLTNVKECVEQLVSWQDDDPSVPDIMITLSAGTHDEEKFQVDPVFEDHSTGRSRNNRKKKNQEPDPGDDIIYSKKLIPTDPTIPPKCHQCTECEYSTDREHRLRLHIDSVHLGLRPHKCPHCEYAAAQAGDLRAHVRVIHEGIKPFSCPECPRNFGHMKNLRIHLNGVHKKLKMFKCDQCDFSAASPATRTLHKAQVHNMGSCYKCKHCDYTNNVMSVIQTHIASVHKKEKNFKCIDCEYAGATKQLLTIHMKKYHTGEIAVREKKCKQCSYTTFSQKFLYVHMEKFHHVDHKCKQCSYTAPNASKLKRHVAGVHKKRSKSGNDGIDSS